jgi:hypothetical protein
MRMSVELLDQLRAQQVSVLVRVTDVRLEADGTKTLIVEPDQSEVK